MKIAHIVSTFPPYYGGMGTVVFETAVALSEMGHDVQVFTPDYYEDKEIRPINAPSAQTHSEHLQSVIESVQRIKPSISYGNAARIPDVLHQLDAFDIVHLHYPFFGTAELIAKWKKRNPHKKLVMTYHMDTRAPGWKGLVFALYNRVYLPKILASTDACIGATFDYIALSDARHSLMTQKEKWHEIPFGVDVTRFKPQEKSVELFQQLNLDPNLPTLLFVGGLDDAHFFKGVPVLLKALLGLRMQKIAVQAVFVGDGNRREEYESQARGYGLDHMVHFVGRIEHDKLPEVYASSDLLVLPSTTKGEAFGMVLLEAFASGVPVIASDLPGVRSVAGQAGLTVPPNDPRALMDAISGFLALSPDERKQMRHQARSVAQEKYQWKTVIAQLDGVYQSLV